MRLGLGLEETASDNLSLVDDDLNVLEVNRKLNSRRRSRNSNAAGSVLQNSTTGIAKPVSHRGLKFIVKCPI